MGAVAWCGPWWTVNGLRGRIVSSGTVPTTAGRAAASGVYHYVLKTADRDLRRKMTLLR